MSPQKIWCNLAVNDLQHTIRFYNSLGFEPNGKNISTQLCSFLFGADNLIIHFFLKDVLKVGMKGELTDTQTSNEIIFTLSASSKKQVDEWAKEVEPAGGKLISQPEEFGEGYYGFVFADPDGHRFNVFFM